MSKYFALAAGMFVGNVLFHAVHGNVAKGVAVGIIAAILMLIVGFFAGVSG